MLEAYGRLHGAVNNHEKPQRLALEERVSTRNPATPAKGRWTSASDDDVHLGPPVTENGLGPLFPI
jgi:hypothetical protein